MAKKIFDQIRKKEAKDQLKEEEKAKLEAQKDLAKFIPIAKKLLKIVLEADLEIGQVDVVKERSEAYAKVAKQIMELFLDENIRYVDKEFVFQLATQPLQLIQQVVMTDLGRSLKLAMASAMGVDSFDELDFKTMDRVWKEYAEKRNQKSK